MTVLFMRVRIQKAEEVTKLLDAHYARGWRVRSHAVDGNEYTFVLELLDDGVPS